MIHLPNGKFLDSWRLVPCAGDCGRQVRISSSDLQDGAPHCSSCIALVKAQVERHAALWAPVIVASMVMNGGHMPEIDPSLLRSAA